MQEVMKDLRTQPPAEIDGQQVTAIYDYSTLTRTDTSTGETASIDCIAGNIIVLECNNDYRCRITIRPSGTEPKIKMYVQWYEDASDHIDAQLETIDSFLEGLSRTLEGVLLS